jgi:sugar phosphate isomerase/epimerase
MGLCLSTAWNAFRYDNGKEIIREIRELGFTDVELSFDLTKRIVKDIADLVKSGDIKVKSLHNYCPIPDGLERQRAQPDCYSLASLDEEERSRAVQYTKLTIETAISLNASAVILHCGRVEMQDKTRELISLYEQGQLDEPYARRLKARMRKERQERQGAHMRAALKSLEELTHYARRLSIGLGIENRFYFREIPSFEEIGVIFDSFKDSSVFYWHDTGHAQLWENLGFFKHRDYLDAYSRLLLGVHLHDINGARDHLAPLQGNLDFAWIKPYLRQNTIKTLEAHYPAVSQDIIVARDFLEKLYG